VIRLAALLSLAGLLASCGDLPTTSEGVAFLEVMPPPSTTLRVGDTVRFGARTLDASGNPIAVSVLWRTPDTTITVDPATGIVVGRFAGSGRVQAVVGNEELVSNFVTLTVQAAPSSTASGKP
jgi:uncharacterized protein YjdB